MNRLIGLLLLLSLVPLHAAAQPYKLEEGGPKVALVLSGGGAKGTAHIGALKYLDSLGFDFDMVVGTSMGSIVGGLYALGYPPQQIDSLTRVQDWSLLMSDRIPRKFNSYLEKKYKEKYLFSVTFDFGSRLDSLVSAASGDAPVAGDIFFKTLPAGFINGQNIFNLFTALSVGYQDSIDFNTLPIPFACVATDLVTGKEIVIREGQFPVAIRASMAIPGVFSPVRVGDYILVDGGTQNNYPVDVARAMGADIVVGVDVSGEMSGYSDINNIGDILGQLVSLMGDRKYRQNVSDVDVHIRPDLTGYGTMSFDSESIDTLINRGYRAAAEHGEELAALIGRIRSEKGYSKSYAGRQKYAAPRAVCLYEDSVVIRSVAILGVNKAERAWLKKNISLPLYRRVSSSDIEDVISGIYSTGAFKSVTYELVGNAQPYDMRVYCTKGNAHQIGVGARFDSEEVAAVLLNAGFNSGKLTGSKYDITARLSMNPYVKFGYSYVAPKMPKLNVTASGGFTNADIMNGHERAAGLRFYRFDATAFISNISLKTVDLQMGAKVDGFYFRSFLTSSDIVGDYDVTQTLNSYVSAFASARADNLDDAYFPTRGFTAGLDYSYYFTGFYESFNPFHQISFDAKVALPMFRGRLVFEPSFYGRFLVGNDVPLPYMNVIGGMEAGRYFAQQMPFVGTSDLHVVKNYLTMLRADLRANVYGKHYVSLMFNYMRDCERLQDYLVGDGSFGAGAGYSYKSVIGPLSGTVYWSNVTKRVGFYVSIGYYF